MSGWSFTARSALFVLTACADKESASCRLGQAELVVQAAATSFDGIALVALNGRAVAVWSDATGSFLKPVADGPATRPPQRIGARCRGGVAAVALADLWVACSRPGREGETGELTLTGFDGALRQRATHVLGPVGRDGKGVALAAAPNRVFAAWGDGSVGAPRLMTRALLLLPGAPAQPEAVRALSQPEANAREPSLLFHAGHLFSVFTESELKPGRELHRLMIARDDEAPRRLLVTQVDSPTPQLAGDANGVVISFRDAPRAEARRELYVGRLDAKLGFAERPRRIGRANGQGAPSVALCAKERVVAVPIEHGGELYVAFHPLSLALRTTEENHQYYESERELVQSAASCLGGHSLALLAERTEASIPRARLLATEFRCTP